jgi:hypothetical protein
MAELRSEKLYEFLCERARGGQRVTADQLAGRFGVEVGAAEKRLSLLSGSCVLHAVPGTAEFDCANVLHVTARQFESADSQGRQATAFVQGLFERIKRLSENNSRLKSRIDTLNTELAARRDGS